MTAHELARLLLSLDDKPVEVFVGHDAPDFTVSQVVEWDNDICLYLKELK